MMSFFQVYQSINFCRPKIYHLNYGKCPIKPIRGQFPLSDKSNGLTIESKIASFDNVTCTYTKCTGPELVKMEVCVLANFSKTAERNKTLITGIKVRFKLSSNQQTDQNACPKTCSIAKNITSLIHLVK